MKGKKTKSARAVVTQREVTRLGGALRNLGGLAGGALGSFIGLPASGASVGSSLGGALSKWLGSGDYTVGTNSIVSRAMKGSDSIPAMHNTGQSVTIRHKEYLGEILGSGTFEVQRALEINPGNPETFPWLSGVAARFQEYRIKGLVFHYIPSSGSAVASTNAALGTVMIQTSYRSNDNAPTSKVELLNEYCSSEAVPSEAFCHPIECDPKENPFNVQYIRTGGIPQGDSKLLYDLGVTHIATSGQQVNGKVLGDLWITYEIELKKPVVASNVTSSVRSAALHYTSGTIVSGDWFNGTIERWGQLLVTASGTTVTFPRGSAGYWLVSISLNPTTTFTTLDLSGSPTYSNCAAANTHPGTGNSAYMRNVLSGTTPALNRAFYTAAILITNPAVEAKVTMPAGMMTGSCTESILIVTPYNPLD